uniref:Fibronectin type-III domain-containing protein n=1 Tax=Sphenodon punctatus TaxID=8508 RepID=A0A8D0HAU0_SPHPU
SCVPSEILRALPCLPPQVFDLKAARGVILGYPVTFRDGGTVTHLERPCCNATLPRSATYAWVSARNSVGQSPPGNLSLERTDLPAPQRVQVQVETLGLNVSWEQSELPEEHLVEWAPEGNGSREAPLSWIRRLGNHHSALLTGDFKPHVPYRVRVYGLYPQGVGVSEPTRAYIQEGAPSGWPRELRDRMLSKTVFLISWKEIPLAQQHGHLTCYTLYLRSSSGESHVYGPSEWGPVRPPIARALWGEGAGVYSVG